MAYEMAIAVGLITFIFIYYFVVVRNSKIAKFIKQMPGPAQVPVLGNALNLNVPNEEITSLLQFKWPATYGSRYVFAVGLKNYFVSANPSDLEKLLSSSTEINKGYDYDLVMGWLGEGLLTSKGAKWFKHRKLLTPTFHFKILNEFLISFNENARIFVDLLKKDSDGGSKTVEINEYITLCALDIICETAMGNPMHAQVERESDYVKAVYGVLASVLYRGMRPWLANDFIYYNLTSGGRKERANLQLLHNFTESVICERKAEIAASKKVASKDMEEESHNNVFMNKKRKVAFMDLLLEVQAKDPSSLTDLQIREETDTFMFAGHDTTSASLTWTVLLLGSHPEYENKVIEELDSIFGDDKERPITTTDLSQMKYLEYCIKESLRLFPSVPLMSRQLQQDLKLDDSVTVPAGFNFLLHTLNIHRNPEIFPEPEAFKPERFFPENAAGRHPYAYIPFSAGPRNCIGQKFAVMEEKVLLASLFRNFWIEAMDKRGDITIMMEIITRPKDGVRVKLTPR